MSEKALELMIEQQLRPWGVHDEKLLAAITHIPRHHFVPKGYEGVAYSEATIPLPHDQCMLPPKWVARALQGLSLHSSDTVLEIGSGSGYTADILAHLTFHVFSVEINPDLHTLAKENLKQHARTNVDLLLGNGASGWKENAPYDVIFASAAYPRFPTALTTQLRDGGRLFVVLGQGPAMQACIFTRHGEQDWDKKVLFETQIPFMEHADTVDAFTF